MFVWSKGQTRSKSSKVAKDYRHKDSKDTFTLQRHSVVTFILNQSELDSRLILYLYKANINVVHGSKQLLCLFLSA